MKDPRQMTVAELEKELKGRIKKRQDNGNEVCFLDLRGKTWANIGKIILREPTTPGWPTVGVTTDHLSTAKSWIAQYATLVRQQLQGQNVGLTVAGAVEPYLDALNEELGADHSTVSQRRSYLRVHIAPRLGAHRLATLHRDEVEKWLDTMQVTKSKHGQRYQMPATVNTLKSAYAALLALHQHHYPKQTPPFAGITISRAKAQAALRRKLVQQGKAHLLIKKTTYTPSEALHILAAARWADTHPEAAILQSWAAPNLAPTVALQLAFATRVSELMEVREGNVDEEAGFILVPGTKSASSIRYLPLQESALPWLELLRQTKRGPSRPEHYLFRTHPDHDELPNKDVYARRMGKVADLAKLKLEGERSHIWRRTHASWAKMRGIPGEEVKMFLGHSGVYGGATDEYIEMIRQMVRPEHRTYLAIPTPAEVDELLATGWMPPGLKKRRAA